MYRKSSNATEYIAWSCGIIVLGLVMQLPFMLVGFVLILVLFGLWFLHRMYG